VPDYALVYGNATRVEGWMCECGEKIVFGSDRLRDVDGDAECNKCGRQYEKHGPVVNRRI
jgi:UDP-2-acetamido-3-amino-2,3-dideoxy-glucuronate N-acetyltransferase